MKKVSVINYFGGKTRMLDFLKEHVSKEISEKSKFVEPYMGSAITTLNLDRIIGESADKIEKYINDLDYDVYMLFKVLAEPSNKEEFLKQIKSVEYCEYEFNEAAKIKENGYRYDNEEKLTDVEVAVNSYILYSMSFNACKRNYSNKKKEWFENRKRQLEKAVDKAKGIKVLREDAFEIIERFSNDKNCFMFVDPPYLMRYRSGGEYEIDMPEDKHLGLVLRLCEAKAAVILWGYRAADEIYEEHMYDTLLRESVCNTWYYSKVGVFYKSSASKKGESTPVGVEYIWHNFPIDDESLKKLNEEERQNVNIPLN